MQLTFQYTTLRLNASDGGQHYQAGSGEACISNLIFFSFGA